MAVIEVHSYANNVPILTYTSSTSYTVKPREERQVAQTEAAEIRPVPPKMGALVRVITDERQVPVVFSRWVGDDTFTIEGSDEVLKAAEYEALTPAFMPWSYERAVMFRESGQDGAMCRITGWYSIHATAQMYGQRHTDNYPANFVAALAPMLNPATERPEDALARLLWEKERLEAGLRARMVAEGVARNWCSEFDPILDSSGLAPRQHKGWVIGTMKFRRQLTGHDLANPQVLEQIKKAPGSYLSMADVQIESIEAEPHSDAPLLSI
jgi:hypothetical protein